MRAGRRRLASSPVDVIYSSSAPYVAHFIAKALSRQYGSPWVADFRDPWTKRTYYPPRTPLHARLDRRLESGVLQTADAVIANTPANKQVICSEFDVPADRVHVIPNGYDPEDIEPLGGTVPSQERFVITCAGTFYEMRDPDAFFRAYRRFHDGHSEAHLRFVGSPSRTVRQTANRVLSPGSWEAGERVQHIEALRAMMQSAVLLGNLPLMSDAFWVPGKLYEYLAVRRPILLIGPPRGEAATILQHARAGVTVENDEDTILNTLEQLHRNWRGGHQFTPDLDVVRQYDRRRQTQALAAVFEHVGQARQERPNRHRATVG